MRLLERDAPLAALRGALDEARGGRGTLAVVSGEAGIGKTSLVQAFCDGARADARVLWGACDDLSVPRPLGAFLDIAAGASPALGPRLRSGDRIDALGAVLDELAGGGPTVCVVEDAHWADEASVDVLTFVARRVASVPAVVVVTVRDDELGPEHPLRRALGAAPAGRVRRVALERLSRAAVDAMAGDPGAGARLFALTEGNPFFLTEAMADDAGRTPGGVRDAVLARAARLSPAARDALDLVSVVPARAEVDLVAACRPDADAALAECERRGLLRGDGGHVRFRHELARRAVEEALPAVRRAALHREVLAELERRDADPARLAHHAAGARDPAALTRHGLAAADAAVRARSHREAAELSLLVLSHGAPLPDAERVRVLERCSEEAYYAGQAHRSLDARREALALRRAMGDGRATSATLRWLSRVLWWMGDRAGSEAAAEEAVALVRDLPPGRELAMAESNMSQLLMLTQRDAEAVERGRRAMDLAARLGDVETLVHAQTNVGTVVMRRDFDEGRVLLLEAAARAETAGLDEHVCRALTNAAWDAAEFARLAEARELTRRGAAFARSHEQPSFAMYLRALMALIDLATGDWDAAEATARGVLEEQESRAVVARIPALQAAGLVALRRGAAGAREALDEAWERARATGELQRLRPVACARAEAAWLDGDAPGVDAATADAYALARERGHGHDVGELALWRWRAGLIQSPPPGCAAPFAAEIDGDWAGAAARWEAAGAPYARALALLGADRAEPLREAIGLLDALGAVPVAARARARLRALGGAAVPRGPRPSTRRNPANLSARQLEVARLVAEGFTNPQIARRLVLSDRTVEHHVAGAMQKLGVSSRTAVADALLAHGAGAA